MKLIEKEDGRQSLSEFQLASIIEDQDISQYLTNQAYYEGKNEKLIETTDAKTSTPNNSIPLPFARRTVNDIVGYSGKPGLIKLKFDGEQDPKSLEYYEQIKDKSHLWLATANEYLDGVVKGEAAELAWVDNDGIMRFSFVPREQCIFEYTGLISDELLFAIRYYKIKDYDVNGDVVYTWHAFTYWHDHIDEYIGVQPELTGITKNNPQLDQRINDGSASNFGIQWEYVATEDHMMGYVPLYPMPISNDKMGVVQPYIPIIDRLDSFGSDSISNAIDQFRDAILTLSKKLDDETAASIMEKRIIDNLGTDGDFVKFVSRETDVASSIESFKLFERIYYELVGVPNLNDEKFGTQSGIAIMYALIPFENLVSQIETHFSRGIEYRMMLINNALSMLGMRPLEFTIVWERNLPLDLEKRAEIIKKIRETNILSQETLMKMFPESVVEDVQKELERKEEENARNMAMFEREPQIDTEEEEEEEE